MSKRIAAGFIIVTLLSLICTAIVYGEIAYVVEHFVRKFW